MSTKQMNVVSSSNCPFEFLAKVSQSQYIQLKLSMCWAVGVMKIGVYGVAKKSFSITFDFKLNCQKWFTNTPEIVNDTLVVTYQSFEYEYSIRWRTHKIQSNTKYTFVCGKCWWASSVFICLLLIAVTESLFYLKCSTWCWTVFRFGKYVLFIQLSWIY